MAKARAGKPVPFSTFGHVTIRIAPVAGTWYHQALANSLAGSDTDTNSHSYTNTYSDTNSYPYTNPYSYTYSYANSYAYSNM